MAMPEELLREYVAASEAAGRPVDPLGFLARLDGNARNELAGLIDAYLDYAPVPAWDPDQFHGSAAERAFEHIESALSGLAGEWPVLLPSLRHENRKMRGELVEELATELGVEGSDREKVATYYHEMETGLIDSEGVTDRVLVVLGRILGCGAHRLREAGRSFGDPSGPAGGIVFARVSVGEQPAFSLAPPSVPPEPESWDEVDRLFRGRGTE